MTQNTEDRQLGRACQEEGDTYSRTRLLPVAEVKGKPQRAAHRLTLTEGESLGAGPPARRPPGRGAGVPPMLARLPHQLSAQPSQVPSAGLQDKIPGSNCIFRNHATFKLLPETYNLYVWRFIYLLFLGHKRRNSPAKTLSCKSKILLKLYYFTD